MCERHTTLLLLLATASACGYAAGGARPRLPRPALHAPPPALLSLSMTPTIGTITANALYFAPLPSVIRAVRSGDLGDLNPLPWALMAPSNMLWLVYALSIRNPFIVASTMPGAVAAVGYTVYTLPLMSRDARRQVQATCTGTALGTMALWVWLAFSTAPPLARQAVLGNAAVGLCLVLFCSPLSTIATVLAQRDSSSIYLPLALAQVANSGLWTAYGAALRNCFVWAPNLAGLVLGLATLAIKLAFRGRRRPERKAP